MMGVSPGATEKGTKNFWKTFLKIKMFLRGYVAGEGEFGNGVRESLGPKYLHGVWVPPLRLVYFVVQCWYN